jgi:hypothetical protein
MHNEYMTAPHRRRRVILMVLLLVGLVAAAIATTDTHVTPAQPMSAVSVPADGARAATALEGLATKGRAPKTDYSRDKFGAGWASVDGCDTRNVILHRDLVDVVIDEACQVQRGTLDDPYTGKSIAFLRGSATSSAVQIDHVVALSDAWQKGAQGLTSAQRIQLANDPLELLAVDGPANQQKSDGDAATWLPPYIPFRCQYVARQIAVKQKYALWVTQAERDAMQRILNTCPGQLLPSAK